MRRTPTLTKQVRQVYEEVLIAEGSWPFLFDERVKATGLNQQQVLDAIWRADADEWRRDAIRRYTEHKHKQEIEHAYS